MEKHESVTADQWRHLPRFMAARALRETPSISDDLTVSEIQARLSALAGSPGERLATWAVLRHHAPERFPGARNSIHHAAKALGKATAYTATGIEKLSRMLVTNPGILASQITRLECISIMHSMAPIERMAMLLEIWDIPMRNESRESVKGPDWRHSHWRGLLAQDTALHKAMRGEASKASVTGQIHLVEIVNAHPETLASLVGKDTMVKVLEYQMLDYANRSRNASDRIDILDQFRPNLVPCFGRSWESAITAQALRLVLGAPDAASGDAGSLEELLDTWKGQADPPAIDPDTWSDIYQTVSTPQRMALMLRLDAVCMLEAPAPKARSVRSVE